MKPKKRCCKDRPRCKSCPVVCTRLGKLGYAEREDRRTWQIIVIPPKKVLKAARAWAQPFGSMLWLSRKRLSGS